MMPRRLRRRPGRVSGASTDAALARTRTHDRSGVRATSAGKASRAGCRALRSLSSARAWASRHFRELLQSDERISSNILADRLARLVEHGLLTKSDDPTHKQKAIYSLTKKAIALLPIVVQIGAWGTRWVPDAKKLDGAARKHLREIQEGGPRVWAKRMDELRAEHLR